jgi:hypothetical protein
MESFYFLGETLGIANEYRAHYKQSFVLSSGQSLPREMQWVAPSWSLGKTKGVPTCMDTQ